MIHGLLWCWLLLPAMAELMVSEVVIDDHAEPLEQGSETPDSTAPVLKLSATAKPMTFRFMEDQPSSRLRYKLEGYDETWQDFGNGKKMSLQFFDSDNELVGSIDFVEQGTSPGWRGSVEASDFVSRREQIRIPNRTTNIRVLIYSNDTGPGMGILAIDGLRLRIQHPNDDEEIIQDLAINEGSHLDEPLGIPKNWRRMGTRADLAELRTRREPESHPILVINDNDPKRYAIWSTESAGDLPIRGGGNIILEWQTAFSLGSGGVGSATYQGLTPGRYWFRVAAAKPNGELTEEQVSVPIEIIAPLMWRAEFWLSIAGITGVGIALVSRKVSKQRMARRLEEVETKSALEAERSRIARDLHDDIGANLARIGMLTEVADQKVDDPAAIRTQLNRIFSTARDLTKQLDAVVWAVDPANDTLESFARYLHGHAEDYLGIAGIRCHFTNVEALPYIPLPSTFRHHLLMAGKEALHNVVSHSDATVVKLGIRVDGDTLTLEIEDDGKGLPDNSDMEPGNGLSNMRTRAEAIDGTCDIIHGEMGGTLVLMKAPIPRNRSTPQG